MELPRRSPEDVYLPDGSLLRAMEQLRRRPEAHELRIGIVYAFDFRTRMLPYWYADKRMAPASVRTLGDVLHAAGFKHLRIVLQQWTPNFRPSEARLDGRPLDLLLVSGMQVHAEPAYDLIRDAHRLDPLRRPLILAGGPKAIYEPTDYFELGPEPGIGADCVVTGEVFVLLELLEKILEHWTPDRPIRTAFENAKASDTLAGVPGLVYLSTTSHPDRAEAISTGVQRLLRDFDELPMPDAGYRMIEPPHRGRRLRERPYPAHKVGKQSVIASVVATQGCKFRCSFCPIPAVNQRTYRHKSPERFAAEIRHIYERFGIREFFGTDDNFFNDRQTVIDMMGQLAETKTGGVPLSDRISYYTEATEFDVHKNRDILPLCRKGGLRAIWFGLEDLTAGLVNKGQSPDKTVELFEHMHRVGIQPMALMIHSDRQPLHSRNGDLSGLINQARYVFEQGAVSYQCTYLGPAVGTKDLEPAARSQSVYKSVGSATVPQAYQDGNHVVASKHPQPWGRQLNLLRAYAAFYNPVNALRILLARDKKLLMRKRLLFQAIGQIGLLITIPKLLGWARKLKRGPIEVWNGLQHARIPLLDAQTGKEINWAIEYLPSTACAVPSRCPASADGASPHELALALGSCPTARAS